MEQPIGSALSELSVDSFRSGSREAKSMSAWNRVALVDARATVGRERVVITGEVGGEDEEMAGSEDGKTRTKDEEGRRRRMEWRHTHYDRTLFCLQRTGTLPDPLAMRAGGEPQDGGDNVMDGLVDNQEHDDPQEWATAQQ